MTKLYNISFCIISLFEDIKKIFNPLKHKSMNPLKLIIILVLMIGWSGYAQIDTAYMYKEYTPTLKSINKINHNIEIKDTVNETVHFDYYITPKAVDVAFVPEQIKPSKLTDDSVKFLNRNYLKIGFGTTISPLIQCYLHNLQSKKFNYGLNFDHISDWAKIKGYGPTGSSDTKLDLFFKYFVGRDYTLSTKIHYNHLLDHYYGFQTDSTYSSKDLKNEFHILSAELKFGSNYTVSDRRLKQNYDLKYNFVRGKFKDMENAVKFRSDWAYDVRWMKISGSQNYKLILDFEYFNNSWSELPTTNRFLIGVTPMISTNIKEYYINVGVNLAGVVDPTVKTLDSNYKVFKIHPIVELQLGIVPSIMNIYANLTGHTNYTSYLDIIKINPYVKPSLSNLRYTDDVIELNGGIRGNLFKKFNYQISGLYAYYNHKMFFVLDSTEVLANRYDIVFANCNYYKVNGNFSWEVIDELMIGLDITYSNYILKNIKYAPYHAQLEFNILAQYRYKDKFTIKFDSYMSFFRKAAVLISENLIAFYDMKPYLDFNLAFEYHCNKNLNFFVSLNNIAFVRNYKWYNYPGYHLNGMIGVSYAFGKGPLKEPKKKKN